jgi:hypothetical protein
MGGGNGGYGGGKVDYTVYYKRAKVTTFPIDNSKK